MVMGEDGKRRLAYSYSALQDRFYNFMKEVGYDNIQRGEKGSTTEHLDVLDFKIQQDTKRVVALEQDVQARQQQVSDLNQKLAVRTKIGVTYQDIDELAKRGKTGKIVLAPEDWETVSGMAKIGVVAKINTENLQKQLVSSTDSLAKEKAAFKKLYEQTRPYLDAVNVAPEQNQAAMETIILQNERNQPKQQRSRPTAR